LKAGAAGLVPGLVWKALKDKNETLAVFLASASAPITNTAIFIIGGLLFFKDAMIDAGFVGSEGVLYFLVVGCAGVNFIIELAANLVFAPAIHRIITAIRRA
jgi:hypothetical protein